MGFGDAGRADAQFSRLNPVGMYDLREEIGDAVGCVGEPCEQLVLERSEEAGDERALLPRGFRSRRREVFDFEVDFLHRLDERDDELGVRERFGIENGLRRSVGERYRRCAACEPS